MILGSFAALFDSELGSDGADEVGFSALLGANDRRLCFPVGGIARGAMHTRGNSVCNRGSSSNLARIKRATDSKG